MSRKGPLVRKSHHVKIINIEFKQLGLFGRIVATILASLLIGSVLFFSIVLFAILVTLAMLALLYAYFVSRDSSHRKERIIEGKLDRNDEDL